MSEAPGPRCPACGGLVAAGAEWCGQCLTPLAAARAAPAVAPAPAPERPPAPEAAQATPAAAPPASSPVSDTRFRRVEGDLHWVCPACDAENPFELRTCARCMTPFAELMREPEVRAPTDPGRATNLSLLYPGLGHISAGKVGEGIARMVIFTWALASLVVVVAARAGKGLGPLLSLVVIYFLVSGVLYLLTAVDARRAAVGEDPVVSSRILLYGASGVMILTVVILVFTGLGAAR